MRMGVILLVLILAGCSGHRAPPVNGRLSDSIMVVVQLPRSTRAQSDIGTRISKDELQPGDLVFFKTGRGENGLHVGIYDSDNAFIHASTSQGVIRSSLDNVYWRKAFWQARRI